jgi:hypothetical protein
MIPASVSLAALGRLKVGGTADKNVCATGLAPHAAGRPVGERSAGWETRDTADWEVCGTPAVVWRRTTNLAWFEIAKCLSGAGEWAT